MKRNIRAGKDKQNSENLNEETNLCNISSGFLHLEQRVVEHGHVILMRF